MRDLTTVSSLSKVLCLSRFSVYGLNLDILMAAPPPHPARLRCLSAARNLKARARRERYDFHHWMERFPHFRASREYCFHSLCCLRTGAARLISEMMNLRAGAVSQIKKVILPHAGSASDRLKATSHTDEHPHLGLMELGRAAGLPAGCRSFKRACAAARVIPANRKLR